MNGFSGEFFGTLILILIGCGCSASVNLKKNYATGSNWWFVCASWGLAVTMGVYVAGFLVSQGHRNPPLRIPLAIYGLFPWPTALPYWPVHLSAALFAELLLLLHSISQLR